jgi:hypothetical protein
MKSRFLIPELDLHQYYKNICNTRMVSYQEFKKNYYKRTWIKQEPKNHNCGQIAIAVIVGTSLSEVISIVGKKGSTTTKEVAKALREYGYKCPDRLQRIPKPKLGIGHLKYPNESRSHWVVVDGDKIYDGIYGKADGTVKWKKGWRITSYLPITE